MTALPPALQTDLREENARLKGELRAARDRQAAGAEILRTIAGAPGDAERSLQRIAEITERLFGASSVSLLIANGERWGRTIRVGAGSERIATAIPLAHVAITPQFMPGAVYLENRQVHVSDIDDPAAMARWPGLTPARAAGTRTISGTPLRREGRAIGALIVHRDRPVPFTEDELALLQSFADQAAIATENARLFNETREALERQTATADILKVIASSPSDVQPVFEAIATSANRLIGGFSATVVRFIGNMLHLVAFTPTNTAADEALQASFPRPLAEFPPFELVRDGETVQFPDTESEDVPPVNRQLARLRGYRSMIFAPLMSNGAPIGILSVTRVETGAFAAHHIQLLKTFADQAAIAIENAQLFEQVQARTDDLRESLQQQTAVGDVLKTISRSTFDLQPVLDTLVQTAARLCDTEMAFIMRREGDVYRAGAAVGYTSEYIEFLKNHPVTVDRGTITGRAVLERRTVQILDVAADPEYTLRESISLAGQHTALCVPLLRGNEPIGTIVLARQRVEPFTQKQIELVTTFADQAVIAIENVRLFDELRQRTNDLTEALTYQTGSGNILKVIASSPTDVVPVLKAIVENACELCDAYDAAVVLRDGDDLRFRAHHGPIPIGMEKWPINRNWTAGRAFVDKVPVHVRDLLESADFPDGRELARRMGHRSILSVPLLRENESIGAIVLRRTEVQPFSDKQIALLETFADQAVIAIGNVRLFEEVRARTEDLRESLEFQTATSDVLKVISSSPDTLQPVLDVIVETSRQLCGTETSSIFLLRDERFRIAALSGATPEYLEFLQANPIALDQRGSSTARAAREIRTVHIPDIGADPEFGQGHMAVGRRRALLSVPLMREGVAIGMITMAQSHLTPFTERQIEVVQTFADQAVIAISNVRLFEQVQAKTRDLSEALQQQTATADVLKVISRSAFDLQTVLDTLVESAARLCEADMAAVTRKKGDEYFRAGSYGFSSEFMDYVKDIPVKAERATITGRTLLEGKLVHVPDVHDDPDYTFSEAQKLSGDPRTFLGVPLLREGHPVGALVLLRRVMRPFTERQIELVKTFADQAVIAIENVRLFDEVQARTRELAASLDELRTAQDRLVQTEKLASLGQLTAGIAHEIKNPLNFVNNFSALSAELTDELNDVLKSASLTEKTRKEVDELTGLLKDNLEKVVQHGKRADSIVKNMLLHSREGSGEHRPADINALLEESLNLAYHGARAEKPQFNVTLRRDFDEAAGTIEVFPQEITRVFLNLISNGFYAVTRRKMEIGHSDFDPIISATTRNLGHAVEIRIRDNGTGIPAEVKEKMFNPFFTTKPAGEGTGLGLSMSHDIIVKQHGGRIDVETEPGRFTEFTIVLPRASNQSDKNRGPT